MDNLQCGSCGVIFHKLDYFIEHKTQGCEVVVPTVSTSSAANKKPIIKAGPKTKKLKAVAELNAKLIKNELPLKFKDISSYIVKKDLHSTPAPKPEQSKESLKKQILAALPKGYCGECKKCLRTKDCNQCDSCIENKEPDSIASNQRKRCLVRVCEALTTNRVYEIEKLVGKKNISGEEHYHVKWKGYPASENSWEPESNMNSKTLIEEYNNGLKNETSTLGKRRLSNASNSSGPITKKTKEEEIQKDETQIKIMTDEELLLNTPAITNTEDVLNPASNNKSNLSEEDIMAQLKMPDDVIVTLATPIVNPEMENPNLLEIKKFLSEDFLPDTNSAATNATTNAAESQPAVKKGPTARKTVKNCVNKMSRKQVELILEELKAERDNLKKNNLKEQEPEIGGEDSEGSNSAEGGMKRAGRSTKTAALDFIHSMCKGGQSRLEIQDDGDNGRESPSTNRLAKNRKPSDTYESNLDLSKAVSAIYIPKPGSPGKFIMVKGNQSHISLLEGANLSPRVMVNAKVPLRKIPSASELAEMFQDSEEDREEADSDLEPPISNQLKKKLEEGLLNNSGRDGDSLDQNYFSDEDYMDYEDDGQSSVSNSEVYNETVSVHKTAANANKRVPLILSKTRGLTATMPAFSKKRGRPKKEEMVAAAAARKLAEEQYKTIDIAPKKPDPDEDPLELGQIKRRPGKPVKFSEYIDPDTLLDNEEELRKTRVRIRADPDEDGDFDPTTNIKLKGSATKTRGRPPKHFNINEIADEMDFREKFGKTTKIELAGRGRGKKNRVFVVMPDGTMVEVNGNDREKAIARASAKMEAIKKHVPVVKTDASKTIMQGKRDLRPLLEECTNDHENEATTLKLPNTVQLVESELPLTEAENSDALVGMYLFRQIYSPNDPNLSCRICKGKIPVRYPVELEKHYHVVHEIGVQIFKAEFSENVVFVCVPSDVAEDTILNSGCRFCDLTLKTLCEVREHYPVAHGRDVRLVPESAVMELGEHFYCSICSHPSNDFQMHHEHMKTEHKMQTFVCKYCNFCTPKAGRLRTHVKQRHLLDPPGPNLQCAVCSVYVHGRERLQKHVMLSHAVQTGPKTWSCAKCLQPCGDTKDLIAHILSCPYLQTGTNESQSKNNEAIEPDEPEPVPEQVPEALPQEPSGSTSNLFYKCNHCSLTFSSEEEIKKHMVEDVHLAPEETSQSNEIEPVLEVSTETTCFLCCMRFADKEQCDLHQHHVHMRFVAKGVNDYSAEELNQTEDELKAAENITQDTTVKEGEEPVSKSEEELIKQLESELMEGMEPAADTKDKPPVEMGIQGLVLQSTNVLKMCDLPNDKKLAEIGFPSKVGHYCHICDTVIKSYTLYYLHMHNLHGLEKRFQCVITSCSRTYRNSTAFQTHSTIHNQKTEIFCSMCDMVFEDDDDLQEHLLSAEHATKYMRVQEKYNRSEPRNYRCKVCHSWFGLFATFVKHMDTEAHKYQCQHCGLLFVQPGPRRNHIQSVHPELANICEICGARLANSQALWTHLSLHSIVYECQKCHRRFLQKEQLTAHMEIHAPPTICPWEGCNRKLSTKVGLYNHMRLHRGDADFKCNVCAKGFFKKKMLETHMKIHEDQTTTTPKKAKTPKPKGSSKVERIQLICAGCLNGFDSEDTFTAHICTGHATQEQIAATEASTAQEQHLIAESVDAQGTTTYTLVTNNDDNQQIMSEVTEADLAAQLAQAVAEATDVQNGQQEHEEHQESAEAFTTSQNVTIKDGTIMHVSMDPDAGLVLQQQPEEEDSLMIAEEGDGSAMTHAEEGHQPIAEDIKEEEQMQILEGQGAEGMEQHETLYMTEEEALLAAQNGQLCDNGDGTMLMHTGESGEEGMVMMIAGDEEGSEHQILDGNTPYTVMKVPTADGGEQVLLIPLNREGGNTVLTLPPNMVLSEGGEIENGMTVSFQTEQEPTESGGQTFMSLPEGSVEELLNAVQQQQQEDMLQQAD